MQVLQEHLGLAAVGGPGQAVPVLDEVQGLLDGGQPGLVEGLGVLVVVVSPEVMLMPAIHAFPSPSRSSYTYIYWQVRTVSPRWLVITHWPVVLRFTGSTSVIQ